MKIALIDPSLFTWPYDSELAEGLQKNGHQVRLYTRFLAKGEPGFGSPLVRQFFYPGFQSNLAKKLPRPLFIALKGLSHCLDMIRLWFLLHREKPDVIHFQWTPLPVADRWLVPFFRKIAPIVLTVHDSSPFNNNPSSSLQRIGYFGIMQEFDGLIVHTQQAKNKISEKGIPAASLNIIPHGVMGTPVPAPVAPSAQKNPDQVSILLFGKLKHYKGADVLIEALAQMPPDLRHRTRIRIVGKAEMDTAPLFALAERLGVQDLIQWDLRFVDEGEMAEIFGSADIMAMPYRDIDASGVLMVALSIGRPIVASRIGLFAEALEDGTHGYLVPSGDAGALSGALARLVSSKEERERMGGEVRKLSQAIPGWDKIGQMTTGLYQSLKKSA